MTPTNKLRFVEREAPTFSQEFGCVTTRTVRILQQWWEDNSHDIHWVNGAPGEWRDVPVEKEHG
jgi:hypothetical protein